MQTITIDEVEYKPEDLTEEQMRWVNEAAYCNSLMVQLNYKVDSLKAVHDVVLTKLRETLDTKETTDGNS
jgi:hypothetical protein